MRVLVDTDQLSEAAAAEVEAIAHMRAEDRRKAAAALRTNSDHKQRFPAPGDGSRYVRKDVARTSDGTVNKERLAHDLPLVPAPNNTA